MESNIFEQLAKKYDTEERKELADIIVQEVREELKHHSSKSLLDYGSGTGLVGLEVSDLVQSVRLVDSSQQMLDVAHTKISKQNLTNATVECADFMIESPDTKVDVILMSLVLLHIPNTDKILEKMYSCLNEGGELLIVDFDLNDRIEHPNVHPGFSHDQLKGKLSKAGFLYNHVKTFHYGKQIFMKQDASLFLSKSVKQ